MNFFDGRVSVAVGQATTIDAGPIGQVRGIANGRVTANKGDAITVAIRPEKINLSNEKPNVGHNVVEGKLGPAAYLGDRSHFYVNVPGLAKPIAVASQNDERATGQSRTDQKVWLTWREEAVVLLDH
jgi:ABC-type Fe3+/spermidine/putrescine transport system ATPase subunit